MCVRYQRRFDKQSVAETFALGNGYGLGLELAPDYNVAPETMQPVVVWDEQFATRRLLMMLWRFLPWNVSDPEQFDRPTINAKGETLLKNHIWRDSFLRRRCLIPADSFLGWRKEQDRRLPYVFAMKDNTPFALGGLWGRWWSPRRNIGVDTFAIITVGPNELVAGTTGHQRMPLIIGKRHWQRWLEPGDPARPPVDLLRPYASERMTAWRTDEKINDVTSTGPELGEPLKELKEEERRGMFG
jgi:putative SOS response-associated peptidase YedK